MRIFLLCLITTASIFSNASTTTKGSTFEQLCEQKAIAAVEEAFKSDGWKPSFSEIIERTSLDANSSKLMVAVTAYLSGPYDGSKTSDYEITIKIENARCFVGSATLINDYDVAD